jgi:tetratricopeptide (TPR) repeat protein
MAANAQLVALLEETGILRPDGSGRKMFARLVSTKAQRPYNHTYVSRWLNGVRPRDDRTRKAIAAALGERLGRNVTEDECGFGVSVTLPDNFALDYPETLTSNIDSVTQLWRADLEPAHTLLAAPTQVSAWHAASLSWLVSTTDDWRNAAGTGERKVGSVDIEGIRDTTRMFDELDGRWGGGHSRASLIQFLSTTVAPLFRGSYSDETGRDLFNAAAQATLLAAWMSYDSGIHGLAQRYFIQALSLAETSADRLLGAGILDAMSHQATFLGNYQEASKLASAAITGTSTVGSHRSNAHFYAMKARALARLGEVKRCDKAMSAAVAAFERATPENDPADWFGYFDENELAAELGHCNRDLGRAVDASSYASKSLVPTDGGYVRSDFFATMVLADAYLDQGELEQACSTALDALSIGESLKSARCHAYVDEFRSRLAKAGNSPVARNFAEQAAQTTLWGPGHLKKAPN